MQKSPGPKLQGARLVLASANPNKLAEFRALAAETGAPFEIVSTAAAGGMPPVAEDTGSFDGNALKKARALHRQNSSEWVLADDSGLCVDALGGDPGVESAYFAGPSGDPAANLAKLARLMRGVPEGRRSAHFACVLAVAGPSGEEHVFEGRCDGRLLPEPRGGGGFGYDPLFAPAGFDRSFAELAGAEKNRLSHRFRAWERLLAWALASRALSRQ